MKKIYLKFLLLLFTLSGNYHLQAQDFIILEGRIAAADSKDPIPFASIGIPEKGIGNISNEAGTFELKIPVADKNAQVCISALGFKELCLAVGSFKGSNPTVLLEPANLQLATVEIKAISAENLVKEAIKRIPENYATQPVLYTLYQRQLEKLNDKPAYIIESVNEAYRNHPKKDYQLTIKKSRGMATSEKSRGQMTSTWVSVYTILSYSTFDYLPYLHHSRFKTYEYRLEDEALIGKDTVYVISFKPKTKKNGQEAAGNVGKFYLNKQSKAIVRIESASNKTELYNDNNTLDMKLAYKACKCVFELTARNSITNFKKIGDRWYLSDAYNEGFTTTTGQAYAKPEYSQGITQLIVTDLQTENARQIPEELQVNRFRNHYSTAPKDMNETYWQQYNVLPLPEGFQNFSNAQ